MAIQRKRVILLPPWPKPTPHNDPKGNKISHFGGRLVSHGRNAPRFTSFAYTPGHICAILGAAVAEIKLSVPHGSSSLRSSRLRLGLCFTSRALTGFPATRYGRRSRGNKVTCASRQFVASLLTPPAGPSLYVAGPYGLSRDTLRGPQSRK